MTDEDAAERMVKAARKAMGRRVSPDELNAFLEAIAKLPIDMDGRRKKRSIRRFVNLRRARSN